MIRTILIVALSLLAGCTSVATDTFCVNYKPIFYRGSDDPGTIRQIRENNAAWEAVCKR